MRQALWAAAWLALALIFMPLRSSSQTTTSVLEDKIIDRSGGVLPKVAVAVKGGTANVTTASDSSGFYRVAALRAGSYTITVSLPGFKTMVLEGIVLVLDRTARLDITMEVALRTESVTVTAAVPLIDSTDSSIK
jgi:hypothetical protein